MGLGPQITFASGLVIQLNAIPASASASVCAMAAAKLTGVEAPTCAKTLQCAGIPLSAAT